ncbi:MAG TPA: AI-2E family transporter [Solirubrobacteraceae bacterium]|jgi:predicted PurR-regulated permease PerM|nr:AI-2E family transporter [Solirubrobacteraceae bacterium]
MTDASGTAPPAAPPEVQERELADSAEIQAPEPPRVVVPRWIQLVALPLAALAAWALAKAAGKVLLLFIIAALIALILNPAVSLVQRGRIPRGLAVLAVYVAFFVGLAGIGVLLANPISNQVRTFTNNLPSITNEANKKLAELETTLNQNGFHVHIVKPGKTALQSIQAKVTKSASKFLSFGGALLTEVANAIFNLVLIFVLSVYMLLYGRQIGALIRRVMPPGDGSRADDYPTLVQRAVSRYVGGQLLFSAIMGASAGFSLYIFGVLGIFPDGSKYAVAFGVFYAVMELVPYIGPILGALPAVLVALFTNPITAVWVVLLFIGLQQLEGHVVAPQVFGHTLRINPLLVIFALLTGLEVNGIFGALVALPILSVVRETVVYLSRHLTFESWSDTSRKLL